MPKILSGNKFWVLVPLFAELYSRKSGWAIMARPRVITSYQSPCEIGLMVCIDEKKLFVSYELVRVGEATIIIISRAATTKLLSPLTPWCCCQRIPLLLLLFNITLPSASIPTSKYNPNSCRHSWNDCRAEEEFVRLQLSKTTSWVRYLITSAQSSSTSASAQLSSYSG